MHPNILGKAMQPLRFIFCYVQPVTVLQMRTLKEAPLQSIQSLWEIWIISVTKVENPSHAP